MQSAVQREHRASGVAGLGRQSSVATSRRHPAGQRFQVHSVARENSVNNDEPGFCVRQWLREQQHQKSRLALRPEDAPPILRMLLD